MVKVVPLAAWSFLTTCSSTRRSTRCRSTCCSPPATCPLAASPARNRLPRVVTPDPAAGPASPRPRWTAPVTATTERESSTANNLPLNHRRRHGDHRLLHHPLGHWSVHFPPAHQLPREPLRGDVRRPAGRPPRLVRFLGALTWLRWRPNRSTSSARRRRAGALVLLFSGGKDSVVMPPGRQGVLARMPFLLLHFADTGHNSRCSPGRDATAERMGLRLIVAKVQDYIDDGRLRASRRHPQSAADPAPARRHRRGRFRRRFRWRTP